MTPRRRLLALLTLVAAAATPLVAGQNTPAPGADDGQRLYRTYCASCHGLNGTGNGPIAGELRTAPADLTGFSARNGGRFPAERLRTIIDGRGVRAHGVEDMPVWGDAFRREPEGLNTAAALARIDAILKYIESLQSTSA